MEGISGRGDTGRGGRGGRSVRRTGDKRQNWPILGGIILTLLIQKLSFRLIVKIKEGVKTGKVGTRFQKFKIVIFKKGIFSRIIPYG